MTEGRLPQVLTVTLEMVTKREGRKLYCVYFLRSARYDWVSEEPVQQVTESFIVSF
jgi:hypothetical protein